MPAAFSAELSGRRVVDSRGDLLGTIVDLFIDDVGGEVLGLLLDLGLIRSHGLKQCLM